MIKLISRRIKKYAMKLNPECIRDILLYLEEHLIITNELEMKSIPIQKIQQDLDHYLIGEIANTLLVLTEGNFILSSYKYASNNIYILHVYRITYSGYQLIETIRPKKVWDKVKSILLPIGSFSIDTILQIGTEIIKSISLGIIDR
jgi:hypothetical protein